MTSYTVPFRYNFAQFPLDKQSVICHRGCLTGIMIQSWCPAVKTMVEFGVNEGHQARFGAGVCINRICGKLDQVPMQQPGAAADGLHRESVLGYIAFCSNVEMMLSHSFRCRFFLRPYFSRTPNREAGRRRRPSTQACFRFSPQGRQIFHLQVNGTRWEAEQSGH